MSPMDRKIVFILGGARSGKSAFALKEASKISGKKAYIATAESLDEEMRQRIEEHKRKRGDDWVTYEEPLKIVDLVKKMKSEYNVILIDCLTLWLSNLMHNNLDIRHEIENLVSTLRITHHASYIVSNEVGMGIVPDNKMARDFRDLAGFLNQKIAEIADEVYLVTAGIPVKIKGK
ncbi:MAG TPA: bifunctional adenosylcobinamide kinase/adenosylcobinamide-phosphate guanylyltransferase [Nitrospiraceae bacterium]|nr:bifunctional adenosylcobinamide kinase/adenosylcobinamide-phosphate guanylyltransferase [Nitrospiraceae bacterium]